MKVEKILTPAAFVAGILYKLLTFIVTPPDMATLVAMSIHYSGGAGQPYFPGPGRGGAGQASLVDIT